MVLSAFVLGVVTHTLARQLGGDGAWQPTVGLSMLIMSITDAPRLIVAHVRRRRRALVQILGWATWVAAGLLLTLMVGRSHDLPWLKALGASAIQLIALLSIVSWARSDDAPTGTRRAPASRRGPLSLRPYPSASADQASSTCPARRTTGG